MMSTEIAPEPLPGSVIDLTGQDTFAANAYCQWITANGATGTCVIRNSGSNLLTCVVSGAPSAIHTIDGLPFNGLHTLEPNLPTAKVAAIGDFLGTKVTIFNMSDLETPCFVVALTSASLAFLSISLGELLTNPEGFLTEA